MSLSAAAFGKRIGVSKAAVQKAIATGRITAGADGRIEDPEQAERQWRDNTDPALQRPEKPPSQLQSLAATKTKREAVRLEKEQIELAALKGDLVDRGIAKAKVFTLFRSLRDAQINWPARVAAEMAAELGCDPRQMLTVLEKHVRRFLDEQSAEPTYEPAGGRAAH